MNVHSHTSGRGKLESRRSCPRRPPCQACGEYPPRVEQERRICWREESPRGPRSRRSRWVTATTGWHVRNARYSYETSSLVRTQRLRLHASVLSASEVLTWAII